MVTTQLRVGVDWSGADTGLRIPKLMWTSSNDPAEVRCFDMYASVYLVCQNINICVYIYIYIYIQYYIYMVYHVYIYTYVYNLCIYVSIISIIMCLNDFICKYYQCTVYIVQGKWWSSIGIEIPQIFRSTHIIPYPS